jgi:hypothetical protein
MRECAKNIVELVRPQIKIWRIRITCQVPKTTDTLSEYVIFIPLPLQQLLYQRASMLHVYCMSYLIVDFQTIFYK